MAFRSRADEFVLFNRELSALVRTRLPLPEGIRRIGRQMRNRSFRTALARVEEDLREGVSLSEAVARHRQHFSPYYVQAIRAGEESGDLLSVLDHLSGYLSDLERLKRRARGAMAYPAITFVVFLLITGGILCYLVPYFAEIYGEPTSYTPLPTRVILYLSETIGFHPLAPLALVLGTILLFRALFFAPGIREGWGVTVLFLPVVGRISRRLDLARFSLGMGHLLSARVPLPDALRLTAGTLRNAYARAAAKDVARRVEEGEFLGEAMESAYFFPDFYYWAIGEGKRREDLARTFLDLGDHYHRWSEDRLVNLVFFIEPAMLLLMGGCVVFVVIGLYYPLFAIGSFLIW